MPSSNIDEGKAKACATSGTERWKAVSKQATCGNAGASAITARIGARLCGSCSGASGTSASSSSSSAAVDPHRRGVRSRPPCTTRWPSSTACVPRAGPRSQGSSAWHGRPWRGGWGMQGGGSSAAPPASVARARGSAPRCRPPGRRAAGARPRRARISARRSRRSGRRPGGIMAHRIDPLPWWRPASASPSARRRSVQRRVRPRRVAARRSAPAAARHRS